MQNNLSISRKNGFYKFSIGDETFEIQTEHVDEVFVDGEYFFISEENGISAHSLLDGVVSQGKTLREAKQNLSEAIVLNREVGR